MWICVWIVCPTGHVRNNVKHQVDFDVDFVSQRKSCGNLRDGVSSFGAAGARPARVAGPSWRRIPRQPRNVLPLLRLTTSHRERNPHHKSIKHVCDLTKLRVQLRRRSMWRAHVAKHAREALAAPTVRLGTSLDICGPRGDQTNCMRRPNDSEAVG